MFGGCERDGISAVMHRRNEFTGMARIKELPEGLKVADLFNGAEGVGGLVTMLAVSHLCPTQQFFRDGHRVLWKPWHASRALQRSVRIGTLGNKMQPTF